MKKSKFLLFFILFSSFSFFPLLLKSWNEDYNPENLPASRTVCVKKIENIRKESMTARSLQADESCLENEDRYLLVVGKEPKGAMALIPILTKTKYSPTWGISWPSKEQNNPTLWHFTCLKSLPIQLLGVETKRFQHAGEITTPFKNQSCELALIMAKTVCIDQLKGDEIFERCSNIFNF